MMNLTMELTLMSKSFDRILKLETSTTVICDFHLRQSDTSSILLLDLKVFIKKAAKSPDVIRAFIDSGGKPLEVVEVIKNNEESSLEVVSYLYQMLRMIIFYIVNDDGQRMDPTVQALKFLVNRNKISVEKMLASSKTSDKVLMLKILSIATSLDSEIGRDILKNIDVFAKSTDKEDFSILEETQKKKKTPYEDSVRLAFVHFMLGFLFNEKDVVLRKKIMQKRSLFEFFLRDIHLDNFETIKSIITCLTKNVLISPAFNKPEKLKIFTDNAIKSVLKLYEWKGEENEKSSVINITHQFLLLLLTSKKHGIVFKALSEKRQNLRQLQVINLFKNVWNLEYPSMLVIEIVKSCPDLMQNVLNRLVMGLQPKITTQWFMCANFTKELIKGLEPSTMINSFSSLEAKKISTNIIKLSISQFILQNLNERALIQQDSLEIRESSVQMLHLMMDRCCKYLDEVRKISTLKDFEKHRIKFDIINHIFTFYPNIDIILNSLYRSINLSTKKKSDENEKLVKSQLKNTLEILLLVIKNFPSIIEKIPSVIDYLEFLRPIYEYQLTGAEDVDNNEDLEIEMKVVKIILFLQPSILSLESEMFQRVFLVLIQVYCCSSSQDYKKKAKTLLTGILNNTNIFQSEQSLEVSIWLETFRSVKRGTLKESASTFVKVLRSLKNPTSDQFHWIRHDANVMERNIVESSNVSATEPNDDIKLAPSPLLPALLAMKSNKINRIIEFVEISVVLLYHSHPQLKKSFIELLESEHVELNSKVIDYVKKKSLTGFGNIVNFSSDLIYIKLQESIIAGEKTDIRAKDMQQLELLINQVVFCAIQLNMGGKLDNDKIALLADYTLSFYKSILEEEKTDVSSAISDFSEELQEPEDKQVNKICSLAVSQHSKNVMSYIFKHQPILLDEFSVSKPNALTKFITTLSEIFKEYAYFESCTSCYRMKIIGELDDIVSSGKMKDDVSKIVAKFPLDDKNCISVLNNLVKQKGPVKEFHVKLLKMLIGRLVELKKTLLSSKMMKKVESLYVDAVENTAIDMADFETILLEYLTTFPHSIADLSEKFFMLVFREDQTATRTFVRLINTVFSRNDSWNKLFKTNVMKLKKELSYPLLSVALTKGIIDTDQLKPIYQEFKSGIIKAIEKPNKAAQIYRENIQTSIKLIELAMPLNECQDLALKKFKFEATDVYQIKMLHAIFKKAFKANPDGKIFDNFVNHWLHLFALSVNKSSNANADFFEVLEDWLKEKTSSTETSNNINRSSLEIFYKTCLKSGLKSAEGSKSLVLLGKFMRSITVDPEEIVTIFDMILTHSNFFNVVFNFKSSGNELKRNLFFLLNVLVQKNPSVAHEKHVPIFLSAYQATMTSSDQLILNLLRFYELRCEIDFHDFRPFLFGHTALAHFTSNEDQEMKLIKRNVDDMNVFYVKLLNSFEKSTLEMTVNNFPIKRQLAGVPSDELDKLLLDERDADNIYDPGYFLPIFEMILVSSTFNFISLAVKNNLLSLVLPALSCEDENMRLLAAHILMKCRETNESKK